MADQIYLVDDHPTVRRGYTALIEGEPGLEICGMAASAPKAREEIPELGPDLAIVDLSLEEESGLALVKDLNEICPEVSILVASTHKGPLYVRRARRAGADGYLPKSKTPVKLAEATTQILEGETFFKEE